MNTPTPAPAKKPLEEMTPDELRAEVRRLRLELEGTNMPHPALWAAAKQAVTAAKGISYYTDQKEPTKRAVELLDYFVQIHDWTPGA